MCIRDSLEEREILGIPIKYGEDRFLTRQIIKAGYKTTMTTEAMCFTKAAVDLRSYFNQQLLCIHYLSMLMLLLVYPFVIGFHIMEGEFFELAMLHVALIGCLGLVYH